MRRRAQGTERLPSGWVGAAPPGPEQPPAPPQREHVTRAAAVRARVEQTRGRLEARRPTNRYLDAAFRWLQLQTQAGGALLAGAIAYRLFLFLLPCVFAVVLGLGISADLSHHDPRQVARAFGMAGLAATAVQSGAASSSATRWVTFGLALFALVLGARNLLRALLVVHALIWQVQARRLRLLTLKALAAVAVLLAATLLLRLVYGTEGHSLVLWLVGIVLFTAVPAGVWLGCSLLLFPHADGVRWPDLLPGSALFGVGVAGLHVTTIVWFAPYLQSKSETYGAVGAALAILIWAYLVGRLITAAAALNATVWRMGRLRRASGA